MRGALYGYHYAANLNCKHRWQCRANGRLGRYVIRQYGPTEWWAIQLFGAVGSIAGEGKSAEEAFGKAERNYNDYNRPNWT